MQTAYPEGMHLQGQPGAGPGKSPRGSVRGQVRRAPACASTRCCIADHRGLLDASLGVTARASRSCSIASIGEERSHRRAVTIVTTDRTDIAGWVWSAIRLVLAAADAPMRPVAIHAAVVEELDTPVPKWTIKNELRRRLTMLPLELGHDNHAAYFLIRP